MELFSFIASAVCIAITHPQGLISPEPAYVPHDPWTDGISGSISPNTLIQVKEGDYVSESVTANDTDSYEVVIPPLITPTVVQKGNVVDVGFTWQDPLPGEHKSGDILTNAITSQSAGSMTRLFVRKASTFTGLPYPVQCFDRIQLYDMNPPQKPSDPLNPDVSYRLYDSNVISLIFTVFVSQKSTDPSN
jgi:hypothetical protein